MVPWWQTPFGSIGNLKLGNSDPIQVANGNVRIRKATASHAGHYQCHLLDSRGITTTVIPFRVNIVNRNSHKMKRRIRMKRDTENPDFPDSHFAAAVSSSVLVTFIAAFGLGAFSQPFVIKCLQRTRNTMCDKKNVPDHSKTFNKTNQLQVLFRKNVYSEDTVDFSESSIESPADTSNPGRDGSSGVKFQIGDESSGDVGEESDPQMSEEQEAENTEKKPKRLNRVIKLYNYDEEGNPYSHVKERETVPTPRQRVMSLTRLQNIMNQAEYPNFSTSTDAVDPETPRPPPNNQA